MERQRPLLEGRGGKSETAPPVPKTPPPVPNTPPKRRATVSAMADLHALPDLTDKLKEHGIHEEYVQFRDGYMRWRRGEAAGAKGELDAAIKRSQEFEHWYPTVGTFSFMRTISFWSGALTMEGCFLFFWVSFFGEYGKEYSDLMYYMTKLPTFCGGMAFLGAVYLCYYELINLNVNLDLDKRNILWCDWKALLKLDIEVSSVIGASLYLIGALLYSVAQIWDLFDLSEEQETLWVEWPLLIGGFLFFCAGVCELMINRVYERLPVTYVWWLSVFDCIGGIGFWLCACPDTFEEESAAIIGAIGIVGYLLGAMMSLLMWRGEQFGTAIIPALNRASREGCPNIVVRKDKKTGICHIMATPTLQSDMAPITDMLTPKLSLKGMMFLTLYVVIGVIQMVVICGYCSQSYGLYLGGVKTRKMICQLIADVCNVIMVHMILMLHSACVSLPKRNEQPYRALFIGMRILSVILVANSILSLEVVFETDVRGGR